MSARELRKVRRAATKAALARSALIDAMRQARTVAPLRDVAAAAGMSHEAVRRLTSPPE